MHILHLQPLCNRITKSTISFVVASALLSQSALYATPATIPHQAQTITQECMIPDEIGQIVERFQGNGQRHVVCIQDLHCDPTAQHNIARIIRVVHESYGNAMHSICREGAWGTLNLDMLRAIPKLHGMQARTIETLISQGIVTGSEQFCTSSNVRLRGIEDETLYKRNRAMLIDALDVKRRAYTGLQLLRKQIAFAQQQSFPQQLTTFRTYVQKYNQGKTTLRVYGQVLASYAQAAHIPLHAYPTFSKYLAVCEQQKKLQPREIIRSEADAVEHKITHMITKEETRTLALSKIRGSYYSYLAKLIRAKRVLLTYYPALMSYLRYIEAEEGINYIALLDDERCLRYAIEQQCASNNEARQLVILEHDVDLMENFVNNRVSPKEAEEVIAQAQAMRARVAQFMQQYTSAIVWHAHLETLLDDMHRCIAAMNQFYGYANKRNDVLVNETLREREPVSVMVVGGYHADAITQRLRAMGIGYTLIVPTIQDTGKTEKIYEQLILKQAQQHPIGTGIGTQGQSLALMSLLQAGETDAQTVVNAVVSNIQAAQLTPAQARQFFVDMKRAQPMVPFTVSDDGVTLGGKTYLFSEPAQPSSEVLDHVLTALELMPHPAKIAVTALRGIVTITAVNTQLEPSVSELRTMREVVDFMKTQPLADYAAPGTSFSLTKSVDIARTRFAKKGFGLDIREIGAYVLVVEVAEPPAAVPATPIRRAAPSSARPSGRGGAAPTERTVRPAHPTGSGVPRASGKGPSSGHSTTPPARLDPKATGRPVSVSPHPAKLVSPTRGTARPPGRSASPEPAAPVAPTTLEMSNALTTTALMEECRWIYDHTSFAFSDDQFKSAAPGKDPAVALAKKLASTLRLPEPTTRVASISFLNDRLNDGTLYLRFPLEGQPRIMTQKKITTTMWLLPDPAMGQPFFFFQRANRELLEAAFPDLCPPSPYIQLIDELATHEEIERRTHDHTQALEEAGALQRSFEAMLPHLEILREYESLDDAQFTGEEIGTPIQTALTALQSGYTSILGRTISSTEILGDGHFPNLSTRWKKHIEAEEKKAAEAPPTAVVAGEEPHAAYTPSAAPASRSKTSLTLADMEGKVDALTRSSSEADDFIGNMRELFLTEEQWKFQTVRDIQARQLTKPLVAGAKDETAVVLPAAGKMVAVGDLHGDYESLREILKESDFISRMGREEEVYLVCTGDFIDRGHESLRTMYMLLKLKECFPHNVFILRGNHEDGDVGSSLAAELADTYHRPSSHLASLETSIRTLFHLFPVFLVTASGIAVVHGGIPTSLDTRGTRVIDPDFGHWFAKVTQLLWNDMDDTISSIGGSDRGDGMFRIPAAQAMEVLTTRGVTRLIIGHGHYNKIFAGGKILIQHSTRVSQYRDIQPCYSVVDLSEQKGVWEDGEVTRLGVNLSNPSEKPGVRIHRLMAPPVPVTAMYGRHVFERLALLVYGTAAALADIGTLVDALLQKATASFSTYGRVEQKLKDALGITEEGTTTLHVIDSAVSIGVVRIGDRWFTTTRDLMLMSILDKLTQNTEQNFFDFLKEHEAKEYEELQKLGISEGASVAEIREKLTQAHEASLAATGRVVGEQVLDLYQAMDAFVAAAGQHNGVIPCGPAQNVLHAMVDSGLPDAAWEHLDATVAAALRDADMVTGEELIIEAQGAADITAANAKLDTAGANPDTAAIARKVVVMRGDIRDFWKKASLDVVREKTAAARRNSGSLSYLVGTALLTALREKTLDDPAALGTLRELVLQRHVRLSQYLEGSGTLVLFPGVVVSPATLDAMKTLFGSEYKQDNAGKRVDTYLQTLLLLATHLASHPSDEAAAAVAAFQDDIFAQYGFRFASEKIEQLRALLNRPTLGLEPCVRKEDAQRYAEAARIRQNCIVGVDLDERLLADENGKVEMLGGVRGGEDITVMRVDLTRGTEIVVGASADRMQKTSITLQPRVFVEMSQRQQLEHHVMQGVHALSQVAATALGVLGTALDPRTLTQPRQPALELKDRAQMKALASAA